MLDYKADIESFVNENGVPTTIAYTSDSLPFEIGKSYYLKFGMVSEYRECTVVFKGEHDDILYFEPPNKLIIDIECYSILEAKEISN